MKRFISMLLMTVIFMTMAAKNIQTVTFAVQPIIRCEKCETKIKNQLKFEKGVKAIGISREKQVVVLKYDADKTSPQKLAESLSKVGYKATVIVNKEKKE